MIGDRGRNPANQSGHRSGGHAATVVWIDREEAILARWNGEARVERIRAGISERREPVGHVSATRHGVGGAAEDLIERDRAEHLKRFLGEVAGRISPEDDLEIVGPGTVREHLESLVRTDDRRHGRNRSVNSKAAGHLSERQLVARVRELAGHPPRRRKVGPIHLTDR